MILGVTLLAAAAVPIGADAWEWETVIGCLFPRVKAGTIWLMAATLLFVRWYHVPIEPFRAAILTTFACYVGFSAVLLSLSRGAFIARAPLIGTIDIVADNLVACYWAYRTWQTESSRAIAYREVLHRLDTGLSSCA